MSSVRVSVEWCLEILSDILPISLRIWRLCCSRLGYITALALC
jgi:hypothetical protein